MKQCRLSLPLPTSLNKLYTTQFQGGRFTGKKILSKVGRENRETIMINIEQQMSLPINLDWDMEYTRENYIYMDIDAYVTRPNVDLDNTLKSLNDSIEASELVFINDKKVIPRFNRVYIDAENPRLELTFTQTGWFGIFDDKEEYMKFHNQCLGCSRYRNGACSILMKSSVHNKVTPEVKYIEETDTYICDAFKERKS